MRQAASVAWSTTIRPNGNSMNAGRRSYWSIVTAVGRVQLLQRHWSSSFRDAWKRQFRPVDEDGGRVPHPAGSIGAGAVDVISSLTGTTALPICIVAPAEPSRCLHAAALASAQWLLAARVASAATISHDRWSISLIAPPSDAIPAAIVHHVPVALPGRGSPIRGASTRPRLRAAVDRAVRDHRPDRALIWAGARRSGSIAPTCRRRWSTSIDCNPLEFWRGFVSYRDLRQRYRALREIAVATRYARRTVRSYAATVCVGEADARWLRRIGGRDTVHVVPNGVDIPTARQHRRGSRQSRPSASPARWTISRTSRRCCTPRTRSGRASMPRCRRRASSSPGEIRLRGVGTRRTDRTSISRPNVPTWRGNRPVLGVDRADALRRRRQEQGAGGLGLRASRGAEPARDQWADRSRRPRGAGREQNADAMAASVLAAVQRR